MLDAAAILGAVDRALLKVHIPEWKGEVGLMPMSGADRDSFEAIMLQHKGAQIVPNFRALLCVRVLCDDQGKRLFTDAQAEDLGRKNAAALDRIFEAASKLNAIGPEGVEAAKKASASGQSADSGSVSP